MVENEPVAINTLGDIPRAQLPAYAKKYEQVLALERTDGVLVARLHSNNGVQGSTGWFNVWSQAWADIGNDPENEVIIITATGDRWIQYPYPVDAEITEELRGAMSGIVTDENMYRLYLDALKNVENVIFGLNVPTIGAIQAPAFVHYEMALFCDLTLCADDVHFKDPHADFGLAPGDGLAMGFQHAMNPKQAAYYLYTSDTMDAATALRLGLVNEVLPRDQLLPRARAIAQRILRMPKLARLMAKQIVRRQAQRRYVDDAGFHLAHELFGLATNMAHRTGHTPEQVRDAMTSFENTVQGRRTSKPGR